MQEQIFKEYADLSQQIDILAQRQSELKEKCLEDMKTQGEKTGKFPFGTFSVVERKSYKYSDQFKLLKADFDRKVSDDLKTAEFEILKKYEDLQEEVVMKQKGEEADENNLVVNTSLRFQAK